MGIRKEVAPFVLASCAVGLIVALAVRAFGPAWWPGAGCSGLIVAAVLSAYMLFFFRDPRRTPPADPDAVLAGADGRVMQVKDVREEQALKADAVRISIFLSLFDVHVNRAPIAGRVTFLGYYPGKRHFTFLEKSSEHNQHSKIVIENDRTRCLVNQIVGPVARRVVYWLTTGQQLAAGDSIGMMKFGSRLDMYFPRGDVTVEVKPGDRVRAGETVVARLNRKSTL